MASQNLLNLLRRHVVRQTFPLGSRYAGGVPGRDTLSRTRAPSLFSKPPQFNQVRRPLKPTNSLGGKFAAPMSESVQHLSALQRLTQALQPGSLTDALKDRRSRLRARRDKNQQQEVFQECVKFLMAPAKWTYGNFAGYQRKVLDLMGAQSWRRKIQSDDDPTFKDLEKELKVLEAMTPSELASNHRKVFTKDALKLIAEKAETDRRFVERVLDTHDMLRADRRWYMIRQQFGKQIPQNFEDREFLAEYDRPFSETERKRRKEFIEKEREKYDDQGRSPPRLKAIWFRKPSCGGNRWSTQTPRWYPSQWRERPEKRARLNAIRAGLGHPGR